MNGHLRSHTIHIRYVCARIMVSYQCLKDRKDMADANQDDVSYDDRRYHKGCRYHLRRRFNDQVIAHGISTALVRQESVKCSAYGNEPMLHNGGKIDVDISTV